MGRSFEPPRDRLGHRVAALMMEASPARDRLTGGMFIHRHDGDAVGRLELALDLVVAAEAVDAKLRSAVKSGVVEGLTVEARLAAGLAAGVVTAQEAELWTRYNALRRACIMVDDFPRDIGRNVAAEPARVTSLQDAVLRKTA
jgi:acyl-CoA dehydrogenase